MKVDVGRFPPQYIFLIIGTIFGLAFLYSNPLFNKPDEVRHFWRAYQVSEGVFIPIKQGGALGGIIPDSVINIPNIYGANKTLNQPLRYFKQQSKTPLVKNKRSFVDFSNTALYSPVVYMASSLGIFIGKAINAPPVSLAYLGSLFNLIAWLVLCYFAIKTTPIGKYFLLAIALSPISIQQATSMSADTLTAGFSFILIALICRSLYENKITKQHLYLILGTAALLALCKQPYFILSLLCLIIPHKNFMTKKPKQPFLWKTFIISTTFITAALWALAISYYFTPTRTDVAITPYKQILLSLTNPMIFFNALYTTYATTGLSLMSDFVSTLGIGKLIKLPLWFSILVYLTFFIGFILNLEQDQSHKKMGGLYYL